MTRIVVKQSVDMRLLSMQGHKLKAISQAIRDDDKTNDRPNLSLKQLANLFGFLRTDEDDNIISVEPDYDDMEEWKAGGAGRDDGPFEWENVAVSTWNDGGDVRERSAILIYKRGIYKVLAQWDVRCG